MIYGERIRLRAIEREDVPRFVGWLNDQEVRQHLKLRLPLSMTEEEAWFVSVQQRPPEERPLTIEIKTPTGWRAIGNIGLTNINWYDRSAEVGIFIGEKQYWNQGYGREAMRLMLRHAFNTLNLNRVGLHVYETNQRGIRSYENVGFVHEGRLRQGRYQDGKFVDVILMSILRSEWQDAETAK